MTGLGEAAVRAEYFRQKLEEFIKHYSLTEAVRHFAACRQEITRWRSGKVIPRYIEQRILSIEVALGYAGSYGHSMVSQTKRLARTVRDKRLHVMVAVTSEIGRHWPKKKVNCIGSTCEDCVVTVGADVSIVVSHSKGEVILQLLHPSSQRRVVADTQGVAEMIICLTRIFGQPELVTDEQSETPSTGA